MTRLVVEIVHRIPGRPWVFATGRLEGGVLRIGDELVVQNSNVPGTAAAIRSIELHSSPGKTTVAVDAEFVDSLWPGTVLTRIDATGSVSCYGSEG
jgi:translation elongation factor EF-Tu-like GTPase